MSLSPDMIFQTVDLVKKAVEIYRRVAGLPSQMNELGRRLEQLRILLGYLAGFIKTKPKTVYNELLDGQKGELQGIVRSIRANIDSAYDLFDRYEKGIISRRHDIQLRVKWAAQIWFSLADNTPEKIGALIESIDCDCMFLNHYFALMNAQCIERLINVDRQRIHNMSLPPSKDYTMIFIDPYNQGRSVVAAAWVYTLMAFTLQARDPWRIKHCHAAGLFVKGRSDCVDIIESLDYTKKSFQKPFKNGGVAPDRIPCTALFSSAPYDHPDKRLLEDKIATWRSRGVRTSIFRDYDYIIVFMNRDHDNMIKLRNALVKQQGQAAAPPGKGKLLMLGAYLSPPSEIPDAAKNKDGSNNRDNWDKTAAQLKTAIEGFLTEEFQWMAPSSSSASQK
ncbi:hypothetical protein NLG97_g7948 [Lecanicillium saksenae]|uniref:Uncharacterized protein n=1 Tax=Lecanicillium saksenae TaxID=468837 RepID=A0ACC1QLN8_9HYPO|nr:hypothetical protein NLG97_g7948 [Lecanicillium saksenae]